MAAVGSELDEDAGSADLVTVVVVVEAAGLMKEAKAFVALDAEDATGVDEGEKGEGCEEPVEGPNLKVAAKGLAAEVAEPEAVVAGGAKPKPELRPPEPNPENVGFGADEFALEEDTAGNSVGAGLCDERLGNPLIFRWDNAASSAFCRP